MKSLNEIKRYLEERASGHNKQPMPFKIEDILPQLQTSMNDADTHIRRIALDIMFLLESKDCKDLLEQGLTDSYAYHRSLAFQALAKIYEPSFFPILDAAINRAGEESKTRWDMLWHLRYLNDKAFIPSIIKWIKRATMANSYTIKEIVQQFKDPTLIPAILGYMKRTGHNANSKNHLVAILGLLKATEGLDFILQQTGHEFAPDVFSDTTCLQALIDMAAPELYLEKLNDYKGRKQQVLIEALGALKFQKAAAILIQQFQKNKDIDLRLSLVRALKNFDYIPDNENDKILFQIANNCWDFSENNSEIANKIFSEIVLSNDGKLALKAIKTLGKNRSTVGIDSLILQIKSSDDRRRVRAIEALGEIGSSAALPALVAYLQSDSKNEPYFDSGREKAVRAMGKIGVLAVVPFLLELLRDNPHISGKGNCLSPNSKALVQVLTEFQATEAIPILVGHLSHSNQILREECIKSLQFFNWQPDHLQNKIRWLAALKDWEAIANLGTIAVKPLMRLTENKEIFGHTDLMLALAKIGDVQALDYVLTWLFQPRYTYHQEIQIDKLVPFFQPLFGELTRTILLSAAFIDCIITETGRSTFYTYSLETAIEATKLLKSSTNPLATKILFYIQQKKPVSLTDAEHEEYGGGSIELGFEQQFFLIDNW